nr:MAG TPA: hypothetical protein [Caudoviricetes sp.]
MQNYVLFGILATFSAKIFGLKLGYFCTCKAINELHGKIFSRKIGI